MLIKKRYKTQFKVSLLILLIAILSLVGGLYTYTSVSVFAPVPSSEKDTLHMMRLNKETAPVFQLESGLIYTPDLIGQLKNIREPSPIASLNLLVAISDTHLNSDALVADLKSFTDYASSISVSVIPSSFIEDSAYIDFCTRLNNALIEAGLTTIQLIWYPQDLSELKSYDLDGIDHIGVVIEKSEDLAKLDALYSRFNSKKVLYVQDRIKDYYASDLKQGIIDINEVYYTLAIKYPGIQSIFSPCIKTPFGSRDDFALNGSDADYDTYMTVYSRLLQKPWTTRDQVEVTSLSPYAPLTSQDILSGEEELLLDPTSTLLPGNAKSGDEKTNDFSYINYRWNGMPINVQAYYPYVMTIDTRQYPNGITRLKALAYDPSNSMTQLQSMDLTLANDLTLTKAPRIATDYPLTQMPIYNQDYIPILMYHTIADTVAEENENSFVQTDRFEAQIKALVGNGYTPINFFNLKAYMDGTSGLPEKPIIITMDDGYLNNYTLAYPIYQKYNVQATLFVSPYYMSKENSERHFGWDAAREMEASGLIDIQSHGYDHTPFTRLSLKDLEHHVTLSKGMLEQNLGPRDVFTVSYPQFRNNYQTRKCLPTLDVDFQITKLAKRGTVLQSSRLKRINVPNTMTPEELLSTLEELTY